MSVTAALYLTIWVALALFAAGEAGRSGRRAVPAPWARSASLIGLLLASAHFLLAFDVRHDWSHASAVQETARQTADVCVFTVTDDRITRVLIDAQRRGVAVRLITDNDKSHDLGSDVEQIAAAGVAVKVDRTPFHMHHKYAIFDGVRLLNGSYNWTRGAANDNEENLIDTGDPRLLEAFRRHFEMLWEKL